MKKVLILVLCAYVWSACSIFKGSQKSGCPSNGKNVGAEKILESEDKGKKIPKAPKFRA